MSSQIKQKDSATTSTYSTRLDISQRELIDTAAELLRCSPARLIRESAVSRAADVVNAQGPMNGVLRLLASALVQQMRDPEAICICSRDAGQGEPEEIVLRFRASEIGGEDFTAEMQRRHDEGWKLGHLKPSQLDSQELDQIKTAFETCATEFCHMILQQWLSASVDARTYKPKVFKGELLGGSDDSE